MIRPARLAVAGGAVTPLLDTSEHLRDEGYRTTLATSPIGIILVRQMQVRPFHDRQIALLETFANEAVIAIEHAPVRSREATRAGACASPTNILLDREAKIGRLVEANIICIFIGDLGRRNIEANDAEIMQ